MHANLRKSTNPDGIPGRVLRSCADQLPGLFTSIFSPLLNQFSPHAFMCGVMYHCSCAKKNKLFCLNYYLGIHIVN